MPTMKWVIKAGLKAIANPRQARASIKRLRLRRQANNKRRQDYNSWFSHHVLTETQLEEQRAAAKRLQHQPLISVLVPTYNTNPEHLRECLNSVIGQTYENWELCISDDASVNQATKDVIREYEGKYKNVHATFNTANKHIAVATNVAFAMAQGTFVSLLDNDDLLAPNALYETVAKINEHPDADLIYSDEDKLEDDFYHVEPFFKPCWSPDFLNSCNYITHFATLSTEIMKKVHGFAAGTEGAQDWDLFLRVTAESDKIYHIPKILYTWRKSATSTAQSATSKPYAYINQRKVLRKNIVTRKVNASVEAHPAALGFWRTRYGIEDTPLVSIVIPTKDNFKYILQCVESILEYTTYPYFEIVVVDTGSTDPKVEEYYARVTANNSDVNIVRWRKPFNFSGASNLGAEKAQGEYLLFLNNDTKVITHDWIQGLLEHAQRSEVGMVGAKLLFPNQTVQHAGVVLSERDIAFHPFYGQDPTIDVFNYIYLANVRNTAAVTAACSMVSRKRFEEVSGFDTELPVTYNDVDLCLKLLDRGYLNVYNPFVELIHYESVSVGKIDASDRDTLEVDAARAVMQRRWAKYLKADPYYNDCFEQFGPGYQLPVIRE